MLCAWLFLKIQSHRAATEKELQRLTWLLHNIEPPQTSPLPSAPSLGSPLPHRGSSLSTHVVAPICRGSADRCVVVSEEGGGGDLSLKRGGELGDWWKADQSAPVLTSRYRQACKWADGHFWNHICIFVVHVSLTQVLAKRTPTPPFGPNLKHYPSKFSFRSSRGLQTYCAGL